MSSESAQEILVDKMYLMVLEQAQVVLSDIAFLDEEKQLMFKDTLKDLRNSVHMILMDMGE